MSSRKHGALCSPRQKNLKYLIIEKLMEEGKTECSRCLFDSSFAKIMPEGDCEYCRLHDQLETQGDYDDLHIILDKVKRKGKRKKYDCLIGISGGLDSSTLLYAAVSEWGLRPLVIHFDNGWNTPQAENNMRNLVKHLNVNFIRYSVDKAEYDGLNQCFLEAGVPDADIPNDIAMTKLMYDTAHKYGIKYILNGHCFRTEGSTPRDWTYMDAKYIRSVYETMTRKKLVSYPLFTFKDQLFYAFRRIKQVRPFHYITDRSKLEEYAKNLASWQPYVGKHAENVYTEFVGAWWLPRKFGIDKRIVYLSAKIRSGYISKEYARSEMDKIPFFDLDRFRMTMMNDIVYIFKNYPNRPRTDFERYNFRKYKLLIWLLMKMKVVPRTFYKKYACK